MSTIQRQYYNQPFYALSPNYIDTVVAGSTAPEIRDGIVGNLENVGWVIAGTLGNPYKDATSGWTLKATSPELGMGLYVFCDIVSDPTGINFTFHNSATGYTHRLSVTGTTTAQIYAGNCQFVILTGDTSSSAGSIVMGGIPYIAPLTTINSDSPLPLETWWSAGDSNASLYGSTTFREQIGYSDYVRAWSGYYYPYPNTTPSPLNTPGSSSALMCLDLTFPGAASTTFMYPDNIGCYLYEPMLVWSDNYGGSTDYISYPPKLRGQMYDSIIMAGNAGYYDPLSDNYAEVVFGIGKGLEWHYLTLFNPSQYANTNHSGLYMRTQLEAPSENLGNYVS